LEKWSYQTQWPIYLAIVLASYRVESIWSGSLTGAGAYIQHSARLVHRSKAELPIEEASGDVVLKI
jgi:hypothetical protein